MPRKYGGKGRIRTYSAYGARFTVWCDSPTSPLAHCKVLPLCGGYYSISANSLYTAHITHAPTRSTTREDSRIANAVCTKQ